MFQNSMSQFYLTFKELFYINTSKISPINNTSRHVVKLSKWQAKDTVIVVLFIYC